MASVWHVIPYSLLAALFWTGIGWSLSRWLVPASLSLAIAPALGWAVFNAAALPAFRLTGLSTASLCWFAASTLLLASVSLIRSPRRLPADRSISLPVWAWALAAIGALAPTLAILPKFDAGGVLLSVQMFDHAKIALIDDIARLGVPPGNPFMDSLAMDPLGTPSRLAYYYLWHFSAAAFPLLFGLNGWEADIGLTWFTAFASLMVMMGLAVWFAGRRAAAFWVLPASLAASARPLLIAAFGAPTIASWLASDTLVQSWGDQAAWVPQHLASADCVVLAVLLLTGLAGDRWVLRAATLAALVAAGFECSTWIGGIVVAAAGMPLALALLATTPSGQRATVAARAAAAGLIAAAIVAPFLYDEALATAARGVGVPLRWQPAPVFGPGVADGWRRLLDLPGFWLVLLPLELPAIFLAGGGGLWAILRRSPAASTFQRVAILLAVLAGSGLLTAWLIASTIANNDLGWRALLPVVIVLIIFAAAGIASGLTRRGSAVALAALGMLALGLPDGFLSIVANTRGLPSPTAADMAASPAMWKAVRDATGPGERVANNPAFLDGTLLWPVNISWALFADRRSCYAGWELARAYVALPADDLRATDRLFTRVFAGDATQDDVSDLADRYQCSVVLITPGDGAWRKDPFSASPRYRLVEAETGAWRLYRRVDAPRGPS